MDDSYAYSEDFEEEEVWATVGDIKYEGSKSGVSKNSSYTSTTPRRLPKANIETSGRVLIKSAPLSIPNWSSAYKNKRGQIVGSNDHQDSVHGNEEDNDDEDDVDRVPPHEWLAKKMARSQISSSSVCEGAGRTLKGRDLRQVRNAVLSRTGFLE